MRINADTLTSLLELDLLNAGWNGVLNPYPGQPDRQFAMAHLHKSLVKKYLPGTSDTSPDACAKALAKFEESNEACRVWSMGATSLSEAEVTVIGEVKAIIDQFFYPSIDRPFVLNWDSITSHWGIGPGASIGAKETDFYSKLATSTLAATSEALHALYVHAISTNPTWTGMEISRNKRMGSEIVLQSRLSFVPKTTEIARTICTEPILNMLFQKGIGKSIELRLGQYFGIDLSCQPDRNAKLAQIGSSTGEFGTIDLSSASDTISTSLCKEILPKRVFDILWLCRTPSTVTPDGRDIKLHMISSMGNAFTFPLQTMIFAALVCSCYKVLGLKPIHPKHGRLGNYAVFGDDIIVRREAYNFVTRMLTVFGFTVNADKSFNEGPFRESCGHDFLNGHDVRGVYLKRLQDANDCYSAVNRLVRWSARHGVWLRELVSFLVKKCRFLPVPFDEQDDAGFKVPLTMYSGWTSRHKGCVPYRYSSLRGRSVSLKNYPTEPPRLPGWFENPDGLVMAAAAGSIRSGVVSLRTNKRHAFIRRRYTPRWDFIPSALYESREFAANWRLAAELLLSKE